MAYIAWTAQVTSNRWLFLPGLVIAGAGMAGIWTPVYSLATRDLQPQFAGVASGVISTVQELGAVLGSAAIGALLQNQLATDLHNRAVFFAEFHCDFETVFVALPFRAASVRCACAGLTPRRYI